MPSVIKNINVFHFNTIKDFLNSLLRFKTIKRYKLK